MKVALGLIIVIGGVYLLYAVLSNQAWLASILAGQVPTPPQTHGASADFGSTTTTNPYAGQAAYGTNSGIK